MFTLPLQTIDYTSNYKLPFHPLSLILPMLIPLIFLLKWVLTPKPTHKNIPSPPKLPIIGNIHQLGKFPHRSLNSLSNKYGKLILLHFGKTPVLIVSSPNTAQEITKTHDVIFANRPTLRITRKIFYDGKDIAFGPYGAYWRHIKTISVIHFFSTKKVQSFRPIREEEVALMVEKIRINGSDSPVNMGEIFLTLVKDGVCRASLGRKYDGDFERIFKEFTIVLGSISVGDFIPWLGWIDHVTGLEARAEKLRKDFDEFLERVVQEHRDRLNEKGFNGEVVNDFVDVLLQEQMKNPDSLSNDSIKALILDIFSGGVETTYTLLEWAMTELVWHPRVMKELREEIERNIKGSKTRVTEDDLDNMKYLKAVIKETLRLHPPVAILPFREPSENVEINGYKIIARTKVIINAWAIQRDPDVWENPDEFYPERFLDTSMDFRGQNFEFIPFGAGRRGCPGASYALATTELALSSLIYQFDWKLPSGVEITRALDIEESAGITVRRKHPLMLIATPFSSK